MSFRQKVLIAILSVSLVANGVLIYLTTRPAELVSVSDQLAMRSSDYPFLSQRILLENTNDRIVNFTPLRENMKEYVSSRENSLGVYFEYLPTGGSVGVNEQLEVKIASLAKVPVSMAVYREVEDGKLDGNKKITMLEEDIDKNFGTFWENGVGTKWSIEQLVSISLRESDNTATNMIIRQLPKEALPRVFDALDLPKRRDGPFPVLSPKSYSSILRNLYLASFNDKYYSNQILDHLANTDFNDKLPSGVPEGVKVSHKIGVFNFNTDEGEDVYSDCGIIYAPNRPFVLCIMSESDEATARAEMQYLTKMAYGFVALSKTSRE